MTRQEKNSTDRGWYASVKADRQRIDDKLKRITWVGIEEQSDEQSTRRFDQEILHEVIYTSRDTSRTNS
ncbi:hypothetical protein ANCCAN_14870 [Ancylostoma caninum]|uniref:Uncharacterized protein n=1 Tax=Ancylostoma caninum TaxID=29170 RepID=A0A368G427_ANCCA|nr:hypothetical protein ANCCAN_14870 [Ancylostoma caninum]